MTLQQMESNEENVICKCKTCGVSYTKPSIFKVYNEKYPNVFWRWSLTYCNDCRREKENKALRDLPEILNKLFD